MIGDREANLSVLLVRRDENLVSGLRVRTGVGNEIGKDVPDLAGVHEDRREIGGDLNGKLRSPGFNHRAHVDFRVCHERARIDVLATQLGTPGLQLGDIEEIVNHPEKALGFLAGGEQQFGLLGVQRRRCVLPEAGANPCERWSVASSARG